MGQGRPTDLLQQGRSQLEEMIVLVTSILHGMWRYRWPSLALAWTVCVVGWMVVYAMPDEYQASTRFYINAQSMIKRVVGDLTVSGDVMNEVNILTRAMLSRPRLEEIARSADLDLKTTTPAQHEALINRLGTRVNLSKEGGDIFRISFRDSNQKTAETVVKTLLDSLRESAYGERRSDSGAAETFIEQQIHDYEERLNDAEQKLANFKRENIGLMPGETGDYYTRLQRAMAELETSRNELKLAEERRAEYQKQLVGEEPVFGFVAPPTGFGAMGGTDGQIAQYQNELNNLLLKYTDNHPDVVALRATIDRLTAQRNAEHPQAATAASRIASAGPLETNPVYQSMRMGLSETEIELATLRTKVGVQEANVKELQRLVNTIPDIERELTALNRDYRVTREQYETLLKRRESLRITGEVEESGDQLQFRVIDPPRASLSPVGPNRPLFLAATAAAAMAFGIALALALQQLNPVFATRRELREITGLPVLGTVSLAETRADRALAKRRALVFAVAAAALLVALGLAVVLQDQAHRAVAGVMGVLTS